MQFNDVHIIEGFFFLLVINHLTTRSDKVALIFVHLIRPPSHRMGSVRIPPEIGQKNPTQSAHGLLATSGKLPRWNLSEWVAFRFAQLSLLPLIR